MTTPGTIVAAFDVDGTITVRDCVVPFMRRITKTRRIVSRLAARPDRLAVALARRDRDRVKTLAAAAAFRGLSEQDVTRAGVDFARHVHDHWLRRDTIELLHSHTDAGQPVVLVSASFEVYLRPLAELLGATDVLATRLEVDSGRLTGGLDGANCRGPEKVARLHRWLGERGHDRGDVRVIAYGDSPGDRELLADADEAHWIGENAA